MLLYSMRLPRIKAQETSFYHCFSRVVDGRHIFRTRLPRSSEADYFIRLMRKMERGCRVQILTYALLSNHFHILCKVPEKRAISDSELLDSIAALHGQRKRDQGANQLVSWSPRAADELRRKYLSSLFDVSIFIGELKGRFAQWFNRRHQRYGVLWAERFKSLLIEQGTALPRVAAYVDLNPSRAGLCRESKDYFYCGYGEAIRSNSAQARGGLSEALGLDSSARWSDVRRAYRKMLLEIAASSSKAGAQVDSLATDKVIRPQNGKLGVPDISQEHIRCFTDGGILGSREFVREQWAQYQKRLGRSLKDRAHQIKEFVDQQLWVLRNRRKSVTV
jgi:putative transposase